MVNHPGRSRLYVVVCASGHNWLVRAASEDAALADWKREAEKGNAEAANYVRRPNDRSEINYLRHIGQADA